MCKKLWPYNPDNLNYNFAPHLKVWVIKWNESCVTKYLKGDCYCHTKICMLRQPRPNTRIHSTITIKGRSTSSTSPKKGIPWSLFLDPPPSRPPLKGKNPTQPLCRMRIDYIGCPFAMDFLFQRRWTCWTVPNTFWGLCPIFFFWEKKKHVRRLLPILLEDVMTFLCIYYYRT